VKRRALARVTSPRARTASKETEAPAGELTVYLAGGFHSGWQRRILSAVPSLTYLDPSKHGLTDPVRYTRWDLEAIQRSDLVFAYLEATNPAGYALALEVGFAKGLGKTVILVDERSAADEQSARHLSMVRAAADAAFSSLDEGVAYLRHLASQR
jgi:hypothetical protein